VNGYTLDESIVILRRLRGAIRRIAAAVERLDINQILAMVQRIEVITDDAEGGRL
jgi:hypothetical protein